jgi:hypothetical protein
MLVACGSGESEWQEGVEADHSGNRGAADRGLDPAEHNADGPE